MSNEKRPDQTTDDNSAEADRYDDMDCRPDSAYPDANKDAATPDHIKALLAGKTKPTQEPKAK